MKIRFTKMQGAGNDFVVLDETQNRLNLSAAQYRFLADRRFGVGADQILSVRPGQGSADFEYVIHNADGGEVEQCGTGARCFLQVAIALYLPFHNLMYYYHTHLPFSKKSPNGFWRHLSS